MRPRPAIQFNSETTTQEISLYKTSMFPFNRFTIYSFDHSSICLLPVKFKTIIYGRFRKRTFFKFAVWRSIMNCKPKMPKLKSVCPLNDKNFLYHELKPLRFSSFHGRGTDKNLFCSFIIYRFNRLWTQHINACIYRSSDSRSQKAILWCT